MNTITIEQKKERAKAANARLCNRGHERTYSQSDTYLGIWTETEEESRVLFAEMCRVLVRSGFKVTADPDILKNHRCLTKTHRYARSGKLEAALEYYPAGLKIEFFQNVVAENQHGGKYDFNKVQKMPYLIRLKFQATQLALRAWIESKAGFEDTTAPVHKLAKDAVWYRIKTTGHWDGSDMDEYGKDQPDYNCRDADGKRLVPGQRKYFYDYHGHLSATIIYKNLNNMWWVVTGLYDYTNVASFELFDFKPGLMRRRPLNQQEQNKKWRELLHREIESSNFERAIILRDLITAHGGAL